MLFQDALQLAGWLGAGRRASVARQAQCRLQESGGVGGKSFGPINSLPP